MTTDLFASGNNEGEALPGDMNFIANADANLESNGEAFQASGEMGSGLAFEAGASAEGLGLPMGGNVMSVGGGVGDEAVDVTYSTKNNQAFDFGAGATGQTTTTTTTTTTHYNFNSSSGEGEGVGVGGEGLVMGVGGAGDSAVDVTYSTKADGGMGLGLG